MKALSLIPLGGVAVVGANGAGLAAFASLTSRRVEAASPPQGRFVEIDGNRIHFLDQGSGPAIPMGSRPRWPDAPSPLGILRSLDVRRRAPVLATAAWNA